MNLEGLAKIVRSNFKKLTESEIVGRIMLLSGRDLERSLKGYEMMKAQSMLVKFVNPTTDGKFVAMLERYPNLIELIDRFECIPQKMTLVEVGSFEPPKKLGQQKVVDVLKLEDF